MTYNYNPKIEFKKNGSYFHETTLNKLKSIKTKVLKSSELAELCQISRPTIMALRRKGILVKVGNDYPSTYILNPKYQ